MLISAARRSCLRANTRSEGSATRAFWVRILKALKSFKVALEIHWVQLPLLWPLQTKHVITCFVFSLFFFIVFRSWSQRELNENEMEDELVVSWVFVFIPQALLIFPYFCAEEMQMQRQRSQWKEVAFLFWFKDRILEKLLFASWWLRCGVRDERQQYRTYQWIELRQWHLYFKSCVVPLNFRWF